MIELPAAFITRARNALGAEAEEFISSYCREPYKAIRVNTLKISVEDFKKISPFQLLGNAEWEPNGFYVANEKAGKTVSHAAGLYYVQEPSAMSAAPCLNVRRGERVLDLCSAPGGKGTQLAQAMCGEGLIVFNEINYSRAKILSGNVERLGVRNGVVTCAEPEALSKNFTGYFDKILVDAPCSGEGMFLKEPNAVGEWSEQNVALCAARQKRILAAAQSMLKSGGLMVYSTCTFSPEEDERQVEDFLKSYKNFSLISEKKLLPHRCAGEGHYVALLQKTDGENLEADCVKPAAPKPEVALYREFCAKSDNPEYANIHRAADGNLYSLPQNMPKFGAGVSLLRAGVRLGSVQKGRFLPDHSLAMCLREGEGSPVAVDEPTAVSYLKGLTFPCTEDKSGWHTVTYSGFPLGWCKVSCGVAKNHLPKGVRI